MRITLLHKQRVPKYTKILMKTCMLNQRAVRYFRNIYSALHMYVNFLEVKS